MKQRWVILIASLIGLLPQISHSPDYPGKVVRIIVPFVQGGVAVNSARVVANYLTAAWSTAFVVENRPDGTSSSPKIRTAVARSMSLASHSVPPIFASAVAVRPNLP